MLLAILTTAFLGLSDALAPPVDGSTPSVSCTSYKPIGWNSGNAKINYYNNVGTPSIPRLQGLTTSQNPNNNPANGAGLQAPTLPANATFSLMGQFRLAKGKSKGFPFTFAACNVSSLELTTNTTQSSCSHSGCYTTYTNHVQVHDPVGRCLTVTTYNTSTSGLSFRQCDPSPQTKAQYFQATQQVLYSMGYSDLQSYGAVVRINAGLPVWLLADVR